MCKHDQTFVFLLAPACSFNGDHRVRTLVLYLTSLCACMTVGVVSSGFQLETFRHTEPHKDIYALHIHKCHPHSTHTYTRTCTWSCTLSHRPSPGLRYLEFFFGGLITIMCGMFGWMVSALLKSCELSKLCGVHMIIDNFPIMLVLCSCKNEV